MDHLYLISHQLFKTKRKVITIIVLSLIIIIEIALIHLLLNKHSMNNNVALVNTKMSTNIQNQSGYDLSQSITLSSIPKIIESVTPTSTQSPTASPTLFLLPPVKTTPVPCDERYPIDLFADVTATYGISSAYVPPNLVKLGGYVSGYVTLPETMLRLEAAQALGKMVNKMHKNGLAPTVLSAYRSYTDQYITYQHWLEVDPDNAIYVSQKPGHSEHQLGTALDFGSPELGSLTGDPSIKFSPLFSQTSEGLWLAQHSFEYGYTLTNPQGAYILTGLIYEPWHYRFVGIELATYLHESGYYFSEYISLTRPDLPCTP